MDFDKVFDDLCGPLVQAVDDKICTTETASKMLVQLIGILEDEGWRTQNQTLLKWANIHWVSEAFYFHGYVLPRTAFPPYASFFVRFNPIAGTAEVVVNETLVIHTMTREEFQWFTTSCTEALDLFDPKPEPITF